MYLIQQLCPRTDVSMGGHAFAISVHPIWKELVVASGITQKTVDTRIEQSGRMWLDACGFGAMYDPDNTGIHADPEKPLGPNAEKLYSHREIRIDWGEWGIHHLTVPGNACGLDLDRSSFGCPFRDGKILQPHNIDSWGQKQLMLLAFCQIADDVICFSHDKHPFLRDYSPAVWPKTE